MVINGIQFRWDYVLTYVGLWFLQGGGFGKQNLLFYLELSLKCYYKLIVVMKGCKFCPNVIKIKSGFCYEYNW